MVMQLCVCMNASFSNSLLCEIFSEHIESLVFRLIKVDY